MKRVLQLVFVVSVMLVFGTFSEVIAQEPPIDTCDAQDQEVACENEEVIEEGQEELIKGVRSPETVAGDEEIIVEQPAVLGESTESTTSDPEVLAETGASTALTITVGLSTVFLTMLLSKISLMKYIAKK